MTALFSCAPICLLPEIYGGKTASIPLLLGLCIAIDCVAAIAGVVLFRSIRLGPYDRDSGSLLPWLGSLIVLLVYTYSFVLSRSS